MKNWCAALLLALLVLLPCATQAAVRGASSEHEVVSDALVEEAMTEDALIVDREGEKAHVDQKFDMFAAHNATTEEEHEHGHHEPGHACLFPSLILMVGLVVYYIISRYLPMLPYTAVMFLIGTAIGVTIVTLEFEQDDHAAVSAQMWAGIDSEVLLLVFLPGLIFKDAFGMNVHLFRVGLFQCLNFAFPMVLIGTLMTSTVAQHIFPYGWSWDLCMTFGSILSATDPVAVAALLEEVGAPPRLKVHIGGEALLNDGAAIVFFTIFAKRYFFELGVDGFGDDVDWASGFYTFAWMSVGGAIIGFGFGIILLIILFQLDRRFSREENIVEVMATLSAAYLGYYVAEVFMKTSGVIATVACAITVKGLGKAMFNDTKLLDGFWSLLEHILNTILFTLGGVEWGVVVADKHGFVARDWGYLFLLYAILTAIRSFNFFLFYPITARIGLKTNVKETLFQIYGGLRGAVGIALALALDNAVINNTGEESEAANETQKVFGMIGGIAFLTLVINGITAGPFLIWLGLADSTESRKTLVENCHVGFRKHMANEFVRLLSQNRFRNVNFGLVRVRVSIVRDLTKAELLEAIKEVKDTTASRDYQPPFLRGVTPYMPQGQVGDGVDKNFEVAVGNMELERSAAMSPRAPEKQASAFNFDTTTNRMSAQEMRLLFISLLKASYEEQMDHGELADETLQSIALEESLEFAHEDVSNGGKIEDWKYVQMFDSKSYGVLKIWKNLFTPCLGKAKAGLKVTYKKLRIERSMNFMTAHESARAFIKKEFILHCGNPDVALAAKLVIKESKEQTANAEAVLKEYEREDIENVTSLTFCALLLHSGIKYVDKLVERGLLRDDEAEHWVHHIEEELSEAMMCTDKPSDYPGYVTVDYIEDNAPQDDSAELLPDDTEMPDPEKSEFL